MKTPPDFFATETAGGLKKLNNYGFPQSRFEMKERY
jgi:hypothetical protein